MTKTLQFSRSGIATVPVGGSPRGFLVEYTMDTVEYASLGVLFHSEKTSSLKML